MRPITGEAAIGREPNGWFGIIRLTKRGQATTRWDCHKEMKGKVIHQVMRQKTPLLYVIELGS